MGPSCTSRPRRSGSRRSSSRPIAFSVVKYAGAAYLIYVGIRRLLTREPSELLAPRDAPLAGLFTQGVVVNVLNPKTALFFLAFLPQFVDPSRTVWTQVLVLGLTFVALGSSPTGSTR